TSSVSTSSRGPRTRGLRSRCSGASARWRRAALTRTSWRRTTVPRRKRGPYRLSDEERQNRRDRMNAQRAAGVMKPVSRMTKAELNAHIETQLQALSPEDRVKAMREVERMVE